MENFSNQWVPSPYMCFINKNRSKVDMKAMDSDLADAYKEKQKRMKRWQFFFFIIE